MGNEASSLPAEIPEEVLEQIRNGNLSNEEIKQIFFEGFDEAKAKRRHSGKKRHSGTSKKTQLPRTITVDNDPTTKRRGSKKKAPFSRCKTDRDIDRKTLQATWEEQKMTRGTASSKNIGTCDDELDPQQVIHLLEKYSSVDSKMAGAYFKSLQKHSQGTASTSATVPKAA